MIPAERRIKVLYVVYWGAMEPLGQSLVIPAVQRLARMDVAFTLLTFEKPEDLAKAAEVESLKNSFDAVGVEWHPLRYHKTPKWPATALDSGLAILKALTLSLRDHFDVVHARTFVAGPMGLVMAKLLGARFVYHNEGFYPDEQVDGGVWRKESFVHRLAKRIESFLYRRADALIVLSNRARADLRARPGEILRSKPIVVVPSAVDLDAFVPGERRPSGESLSVVYLGSAGLRYRLDDAGRFVKALLRLKPAMRLTVVSRANRQLVESMLDDAQLPREAWSLKELPHEKVPEELRRHDAGLFFLTEGLSEHGCSPTKIGEYWATGIPVVTTPNVSDTDDIVRSNHVGVVVLPTDPSSLDIGAKDLLALLQDGKLQARCRDAAIGAYSLDEACKRQRDLYRSYSSI